MKKLKFFFAFLILISGLTLIPHQTQAQSVSLGIYPPLLEVMIMPGKSITQVYKLYNSGETDLVMTSQILPFTPKGEKGEIEINDHFSNLAASPHLTWFSFQNADLRLNDKFFLKANSQQEVVLKLKVPETAQENDYYATLIFETIPSATLGTSGAEAQAKIGSNLLVTVSRDGQPPKKAAILEFKIPKIIDSFDQPEFLLRVENKGKTYFKPMGTITVTGWLNQKFILDLLSENILAGSIRQIRCQKDDNPQFCRLNTKFLLGPYQAKVEFGLDQLSDDYTAEFRFFTLPIKLILGLTVVVTIIWLSIKKISP